MHPSLSQAELKTLCRQPLEPEPSAEELRAMNRGALFRVAFAGVVARNRRRRQAMEQAAADEPAD